MKRKKIWFKVFPDDYLWGTTKAELEPDERSVWFDFLCVAAYKEGSIDITYPQSLASKFLIPLALLKRCIKKFEKHGKIEIYYNKKENKKFAKIKKWEKYQAPFLTSKGESNEKDDVNDATLGDDIRCDSIKMKEDEMRKNELRKNEKESQNGKSPKPSLNSFSSSLGKSFNEKKEEFLSLLRDCKDYPFNEASDTIIFEIVTVKHPYIDITYQLKKKIEWWKKKASPTAMKSKPRTQLLDHFEKAFDKKGSPEKVGDLAEKFIVSEEIKDQIAWLEREIRRVEAKP